MSDRIKRGGYPYRGDEGWLLTAKLPPSDVRRQRLLNIRIFGVIGREPDITQSEPGAVLLM